MKTRPIHRALLAGSSLFCLTAQDAMAQGVSAQTPSVDMDPPRILSDPVLTPNPSGAVPLAGRIELTTDEPTRVFLTIKESQRSWYVLAEPEFATDHEVPVLGVRSDRTHYIAVTVQDAAGNKTTATQTLVWTTPPLPAFFPPMQVTVSQPTQMEPGVTFFNVTNDRFHPSFLVIVDEAGEVVWYYQTEHFTGDARRLRNGNFFYNHDRFTAIELDVYGNRLNEWFASALHPERAPEGSILVPVDTFHHEIFEMPDTELADFLVLGTERRTLPDYPANETDQSQTNPTAEVIGDVIAEFTRDGQVLRQISLFDVIDPYRLCYDGLINFWNTAYVLPDTEDWTHGNAVVFDPYDESYILSLRHQEAAIKVRRDTGELVWILGPHGKWGAPWTPYLLTPVGSGPFEWNYHQHATDILTNGDIMLFDNGNGRALPPDPQLPWNQRYSRAVRYRIDELAMTVEQVWAYGGPAPAEQYYSNTRGDADELFQTGNVLVTDSDRRNAPPPELYSYARIVEVTQTDPPQIVFELYVRDLATVEPKAWNVYRSERLKSIYPD